MTVAQLKASLDLSMPPSGQQPAVIALWHDAKGDWEAAHRVAQDIDDESGAWVHAYLHRKEGDLSNADYWYRQAGRPAERGSLAMEWDQIAAALLR